MSWNGSGVNASAKRPAFATRRKKFGPLGWSVVAILFLAGCATALYFVRRGGASVSDKPSRSSKLIADKGSNVVKRVAREEPVQLGLKTPERAMEDSKTCDHGFPGLQTDSNGQMWYRGVKVPDEPAGSMRRKGKPYGPRRYFKRATDNYLATMFITGLLGGKPVASGELSPKFMAALENSLKQPVEFLPDDDEDMQTVKRLMQELKDDINGRIAKGENLSDILAAEKKEQAKIADARENYQKTFRELLKKEGTTLEDVEDFLNAANGILNEHHAMPLRAPPAIQAKIRARDRRKMKAEQENK